jgi:hypothetical protein
MTAFADHIKSLGFTVYMATAAHYGFITDDTGSRVLSFNIRDGSLGGNYGPPSRESGTGWRMETRTWDLKTAEDVHRALYAEAPSFAGKGWKNYTTAAQHLKTYGASSRYALA